MTSSNDRAMTNSDPARGQRRTLVALLTAMNMLNYIDRYVPAAIIELSAATSR